jgi:hypothetical protein
MIRKSSTRSRSRNRGTGVSPRMLRAIGRQTRLDLAALPNGFYGDGADRDDDARHAEGFTQAVLDDAERVPTSEEAMLMLVDAIMDGIDRDAPEYMAMLVRAIEKKRDAADLKLIRELYVNAFGNGHQRFDAEQPGDDTSVTKYCGGGECVGCTQFRTPYADQAKLIRVLLNFAARSAGCLLED